MGTPLLRCAALLLVLLAAGPLPALGHHLGPTDVRGVHLVPLLHPAPVSPNESAPLARFDRVLEAQGLPLGEGGGPRLETTTTYRRLYASRLLEPPGGILHLEGKVNDTALDADASWQANAATNATLELHIVLIQERFTLDPDRPPSDFVVRDQAEPTAVATGALRHVAFRADAGWEAARMGFVAYVQPNATSPNGSREVVQAAVWLAGQEGPTHQVAKAVLVELVTAVECPSCVFAEDAFEELARELGPASLDQRGPGSYFHAGPAYLWLLAGVGGALILAGLRPRRTEPSEALGGV